MEIVTNKVTITSHTGVHLAGDSIEVFLSMGGAEETLTRVSLDSLLQEHLDMHELYLGGGYSREALPDLLQIRKLVNSYIRKVKASPKGSEV